jgi:hypothetical protein
LIATVAISVIEARGFGAGEWEEISFESDEDSVLRNGNARGAGILPADRLSSRSRRLKRRLSP